MLPCQVYCIGTEKCCVYFAGTAIYIAPEVLKMKYSLPADLWSAGIIAYQLVTGRLPFTGEEGEEVSVRYMEKQQFDHKVGTQATRRTIPC